MRSIDPNERVSGGFQPSPLPPVAPDGGLALEPAPTEPLEVAPIALCSIGPCARHHELVTKINAQEALDGSAGRVHLQVIRTCYPAPGIEVDLSETPVRQCSLWKPPLTTGDTPRDARELETARRYHRVCDEYKAFIASWQGAKLEGVVDGDR